MSLLSYSGITTKIRGMQSKLLTEEELNTFSSQTSVQDAVAYLKHLPAYRSLFADIDETMIHRGQAERLLHISLYTDYAKIYNFSTPKQRKFLKIYLMKYEIEILKKCLCAIFNGNFDISNKDILITFLNRFSRIDTTILFGAKSMDEFVESLKNTGYYHSVKKISELSNPTMFDYEITLDVFYFSQLWKMNKKIFKGKEEKLIATSFGSKIDMLNLQWIYRSKKYYNLSNADIYALIIPVTFKLKRSELVKLVEAENTNDFIDLLHNTYYSKRYQNTINSGDDMETMYVKVLDKVNYAESRKNPYTVAIINTYLYRKEHEVSKLISCLESIRYGLNVETANYAN